MKLVRMWQVGLKPPPPWLQPQTSNLDSSSTFDHVSVQLPGTHHILSLLMINRYKYRPLDESRDEIRLVRLFPNTSSTDIDIEIFYANRSANPVYEALSYVCGFPEPVDVAFVREEKPRLSKPRRAFHRKRKQHSEDLATLPITRKLGIALRHL
jgi:hypothetical protein